jgi:PBP1b-binding outer membrane lipoprotein LpoB
MHLKSLSFALVPALALGCVALTGCGGKTVTRTESGVTKDLSGRWNDADAKQVANEMIAKALNAGWIATYSEKNKREPKLQLGKVNARADGEVISTDVFMQEIRSEFVNSGKVIVLDEDKSQTRDEVADQSAMSKEGKKMAEEDAADFLLKGKISVANDAEGREAVKFYLVSLEITDVQSRRIIWQANTKIRKEVEQSRWK